MAAGRTTDSRKLATRRTLFLSAAVLQVGCGLAFASDIFVEISDFTDHTWIELLGVAALAIGAFVTLSQYRQLLHRNTKVERALGAARGDFQGAVEEHFRAWQLTEAERDVALLSIKGVPVAEIAIMRQTQPGTIKAQSAAIYRKAGVSSRAELISVVIEELIAGLDLSAGQEPSGEMNRT
jgi:DNA-binding CsgD family transcriptional regulator